MKVRTDKEIIKYSIFCHISIILIVLISIIIFSVWKNSIKGNEIIYSFFLIFITNVFYYFNGEINNNEVILEIRRNKLK